MYRISRCLAFSPGWILFTFSTLFASGSNVRISLLSTTEFEIGGRWFGVPLVVAIETGAIERPLSDSSTLHCIERSGRAGRLLLGALTMRLWLVASDVYPSDLSHLCWEIHEYLQSVADRLLRLRNIKDLHFGMTGVKSRTPCTTIFRQASSYRAWLTSPTGEPCMYSRLTRAQTISVPRHQLI